MATTRSRAFVLVEEGPDFCSVRSVTLSKDEAVRWEHSDSDKRSNSYRGYYEVPFSIEAA